MSAWSHYISIEIFTKLFVQLELKPISFIDQLINSLIRKIKYKYFGLASEAARQRIDFIGPSFDIFILYERNFDYSAVWQEKVYHFGIIIWLFVQY